MPPAFNEREIASWIADFGEVNDPTFGQTHELRSSSLRWILSRYCESSPWRRKDHAEFHGIPRHGVRIIGILLRICGLAQFIGTFAASTVVGYNLVAATTMLLPNTIDDDVRAAPSLKRADLLRLTEPRNLTPLHLQLQRNYAFELVGSVLAPFLWLSGLKSNIAYGDYDDSLSFAQIDPAAIQIISLDFERYGGTTGSATFRCWFAGRLEALRGMTDRPIVVSNWPSEELYAEEFNFDLEKTASDLPSVFVWDIAAIFRNMNGEFFDERAAAITGTRLSNSACIEMARGLGLVRLPSVLLPRIKAIALDLDNTLYDGVLGEDGVEGVRVSAEHEAIYKELLRLRDEGVFLAVLSKNDERDVIALCEKRTDFLLKPEHFSASSVGWHPKPEGVARIAEQLRIGVDSILVVDDNVGEIAQIRATHANTPLLHSQNPAQTLFWLRHYPALNGYRANSTTTLRVNDLEAVRQRDLLRSSTSSTDYVREMQIELSCALNPASLRGRLAELSQKTNQFNTGLQRFSEVEVVRRLEAPGHFTISIGMRDRFCDSGIIGAIFARTEDNQLVIDEISISCRALGRNIESPMIALALAPIIERYGLRDAAFSFREGPRNLPARMWLSSFTGAPDISNGSLTTVAWKAIPQLKEHLGAPIASKWEQATR
jgi:FkbH-like protein